MAISTTLPQQAPRGARVHEMSRLPFAADSYVHPSLPLSAKRVLNLMAEKQPADARTSLALVSTPGLAQTASYGVGPIWAMNDDLPGRLYVVSNDTLYRVSPSVPAGGADVVTNLGVIGTTTSNLMVTIAVSPVAVVVVVPPNAWTATHSEALNPIGGGFPGASSVTWMDEYFVFTSTDNSSEFFASNVADPTQYNALSFAFSDGLPNVVRRVVTHRGLIWLFGEGGIQIFYDAGSTVPQPFPFAPYPGGVLPQTSANPRSIAEIDGSLFWASTDGCVYRTVGILAKRISTHGIEPIIRMEGAINADAGLAYTQDGHSFYSVTFGNRTLTYDCSTELWHERSSSADGAARWRPQCACMRSDVVLLGDGGSPNVFYPDPALSTDGGVAVPRQATLPTIWAGTRRGFMHRLEIEMETGVTGDILVEWSDDGGFTYNGSRIVHSGAAFEHRIRAVLTRMGSFRQRTLRITAYAHCTLYGADADLGGAAA